MKHTFTVLVILLTLALANFSASAQEPIVIQVMTQVNELPAEMIAAFEAANPDIQIDFVDQNTFNSQLARSTGLMPDVMRVSAQQLPGLIDDGLLLDLTDYFQSSEIISLDDLTSAVGYFEFNGQYYGLPKDWSPDFTVWVSKSALETAGLPIPSTTEPLTYAELAELARSLTIRDGDTVVQHGLLIPNWTMTMNQILLQRGTSMFNEDYTELLLVDNPLAMEVAQLFYDMTLDGSLAPDFTSMGQAWGDGLPMVQWGYWYGGSLAADSPLRQDLVLLPAPVWDHSVPRVDTTGGPVGLALSATSEHPDEAYRFFEWYLVGEAGTERASHGWGAPPLTSMFDLLPRETDFDAQRLEVMQGELEFSNWTLPVYPYVTTESAFLEAWQTNIALALQGEIDFETFASNVQEEVNLAILNEQFGG